MVFCCHRKLRQCPVQPGSLEEGLPELGVEVRGRESEARSLGRGSSMRSLLGTLWWRSVQRRWDRKHPARQTRLGGQGAALGMCLLHPLDEA